MKTLMAVKQTGGRWKVVSRGFSVGRGDLLWRLVEQISQDWMVQLAVANDEKYAVSTSCKKAVQLYQSRYPESLDAEVAARWNGRGWSVQTLTEETK